MKKTLLLTVLCCVSMLLLAAPNSFGDPGYREKVLGPNEPGTCSLAFSPDGSFLAAGNRDASISLWDIGAVRKVNTFFGHDATSASDVPTHCGVNGVAFSPDGKLLASAGKGPVIIWDTTTGKKLQSLGGHEGVVGSVAFSPDGKILASGGADAVILWNTATWEKVRELKGQSRSVNVLVFGNDGKSLASGSGDRTIMIWDVTTGNRIRTLDSRSREVFAIDISPDGKGLASGGNFPSILFWDLTVDARPRVMRTLRSRTFAVRFAPKGNALFVAHHNGRMDLWDIGGKPVRNEIVPQGVELRSVTISRDGRMIASGDANGMLILRTAAQAQEKP